MALKNIRHEKFCNEIMIDGKTNKQAYLDTYPQSNEKSAESSSSDLLTLPKIRTRCLEILQTTTGLRLNDVLCNLKELSKAEKVIVIKDKISKIEDNQVRTQANALLLRLFGVLEGRQSNTQIDARQVHFTLNDKEDINRLNDIIGRLERLEERDDKISGELNRESEIGDGG